MTMAKRIVAAAAAAVITLSAASAAFAFPAGPGGFANPQGGGGGGGAWPGNPGGGPGGFANPQGGGGGGGGFNPGLGIVLGIGAVAAGAMAASAYDDDLVCWKEKRKGKLVTVCMED